MSRRAGVDSVFVRNDLYAPVEIELGFTGLKNIRSAPRQPIRRVLPARSRQRLAQLTAVQAGKPLIYVPQFRYSLGDPAGAAQAYRYPLPWRGGPFRLTQGANGRYSHFGPKSRYAMDIAMPEGTPIIAARGGVVVKTENRQSGRGTDPSGNFVRVLHNDGTMGCTCTSSAARSGCVKASGSWWAARWRCRATPATAAARTCTSWCSAIPAWGWCRFPISSTSPSAACRISR